MSEIDQLPPNYWDDVNRYCGELLAGVPVERVRIALGITIVRSETQRVTWQAAQENTETSLVKGNVWFLGRITRKEYYALSLRDREPLAGTTAKAEHGIIFDPQDEVITRAFTGLEFKLPEKDKGSLIKLIKYTRQRNKSRARHQEMGLHIPSPQDYGLLLNELQRGAERRT